MDIGWHPGNDSVDKEIEYPTPQSVWYKMSIRLIVFVAIKKAAILLNPAIAAGCVVSYYCSYNAFRRSKRFTQNILPYRRRASDLVQYISSKSF